MSHILCKQHDNILIWFPSRNSYFSVEEKTVYYEPNWCIFFRLWEIIWRQQTENQIHGCQIRTEWRQGSKESRGRSGKGASCQVYHTNVEDTGAMVEEIMQRVSAAWRNWKRCSGMLCDRRMPVKPKGMVCKLVVRPAMLYGAEEVRMPADHLVCHAVLALGQRAGSPYQPLAASRWTCPSP